ncbi:MAG: hypothetical protein QM820_03870 [Minicystis sp.]
MRRACLGWFLGAAIAGCGGKVAVDANGNTTGNGGAGTSSTSSSAGTGGTAVKVCGGEQELKCGPDEWCKWDEPGTCGIPSGTGVCQPKPGGPCPDSCFDVCGCDGITYCNECQAQGSGFDTSGWWDVCNNPIPDDNKYVAYTLPTNAPRYAITKAEYSHDRCVFIFVAGFQSGGSFPDVQTPMGWTVEGAGVTPHAEDCSVSAKLWPATPETVKAVAAKGTIVQDSTTLACTVGVDVAITFPPGSPSWVPAKESMQANELVVQGGGCQF